MTGASLLLGLTLMLALASVSPALVWQSYSPAPGQTDLAGQAFAGSVAAFCLNCSDSTTAQPMSSGMSSQPTAQLIPGGSSIMLTPGRTLCDEEDARVWRGRMRSRWERLGFDSGVFELFMRMKGARTRLNLLDSLSVPKDRMTLARELGLDWRAVDYQILRLGRCGLVYEERTLGNIKLFGLTSSGAALLLLMRELEAEDGLTTSSGAPFAL